MTRESPGITPERPAPDPMLDLARRAAQSEHFPKPITRDQAHPGWRDGIYRDYDGIRWVLELNDYTRGEWLPDFTDAATMGVLLKLAREAWAGLGFVSVRHPVAESLGEPWDVVVFTASGDMRVTMCGTSEADALVKALLSGAMAQVKAVEVAKAAAWLDAQPLRTRTNVLTLARCAGVSEFIAQEALNNSRWGLEFCAMCRDCGQTQRGPGRCVECGGRADQPIEERVKYPWCFAPAPESPDGR